MDKNAIRHATHVEKDDPFLAARMASQGERFPYDYTKTRRIPAPILDRFSLVRRAAK